MYDCNLTKLAVSLHRIVFRCWIMQIPCDRVGELWPGGVPSRAKLPAPDTVQVLGHNMDATTNLAMIRKGTMMNSRGCQDCVSTIEFRTKALVFVQFF